MAGHVGEDCFGVKLSLIVGIMNSTDRREEKRNFLIQGRRFRRSFNNYCNYRYFMKLSRLLSIVKLGIDVLLSEQLQSRCIDSSMYRYTPNCQTVYSKFILSFSSSGSVGHPVINISRFLNQVHVRSYIKQTLMEFPTILFALPLD